jgi:hypothetical protein
MIFYQILRNSYLGDTIGHATGHGIPLGYTSKVPPVAGAGEYVRWHGQGWELTTTPPPVTEPAPPAPQLITKVAFRFRMTDAEYVAILQAADSDYAVKAWVETFNMVSQVNLTDARTKSGLDMMVSKNLLTEPRANEILTAPVQPGERP